MIKELVDDILGIARKHISVNTVSYKRELNINDLHSEPSFQFILMDDGLMEKQITEGIITLKIGAYILGFVGKGNKSLDIQDEATHICLDIIEYINNNMYQMQIRDFSIAGISEYSDNNCSGVYATLQFILPNPVNLCEYKEHFIDKPSVPTDELELSNGDECTNTKYQEEGSTLRLNPIKLR